MIDNWTGEAKAIIHLNQLKMAEVAEEAGCSVGYLSMVLNCKRRPKDAQAWIMGAIRRAIDEKVHQNALNNMVD